MTETIVVNCKTDQYDTLIDRTTVFGNPFPEWKWGREECIRKFESYFYDRIERDPEWRAKVLELKGKRIACHCKPLDCHGDIIADWLNAYDWLENIKLLVNLRAIWADIDRLATEEGWYEPELQGELSYRLSQIDNPVAARLVQNLEDNYDYDLMGAVLNMLKEAK